MYYIAPSQLSKDSRYMCAVGLARMLETKLLDKPSVNRLVESRDIHALKRELGETQYHYLTSVGTQFADFEPALHEELKRAYQLISSIAPEPELINLWRSRYDFHDLKAAYKAKIFGESADAASSGLGAIDIKLIKLAIKEDNLSLLPQNIRKTIKNTIVLLGDARGGINIDTAFDKAMYNFLYLGAKKSNCIFFRILIQQYIDLTNLKIYLRLKKRAQNKKLLAQALLEHGLIEKQRFLDLYELPVSELPSALAHTPYTALISEVLPRHSKQGNLDLLEGLTENYLSEYIQLARLTCMGAEPLIAYLWAKENEIKLLRTILVGKLNNLSKEVIKRRITRV